MIRQGSANNAAESKGKITNKYFRIEKLTFFSYLKSEFFLFIPEL